MARKYARDNRGRFASKGAGATARGGRLKTAGGNKRDGQTIQAKGGPKGTIGKPKGLKPGAAKTSGGKWMPVTNSKGQVVGMRDRSKPAPSAAAVAQAARSQRANRNLNAAMKREADGPGSKASRSASVAKRAAAIYAGKVDAKQKTGARLTKTNNAEALRKRVKKIKDKPQAKRSKLDQLKQSGATKPVADGLQAMGNKAINRVATANRLSQLQKQGKLSNLSASQSKRAQSIFFDAQRKVNVAPRVAVEGYKRDLAIKTDKMRRATTAVPGSAKNSAALVAKSIKASSIQRSEAASAKRTFGVRSTISNPGRRSMNLPRQASSTGARVAVSGRTKKQAGLAQSARINRFMDANRVGKGTFKRAVTRQPNFLTGRVDRVAQGKLRPGPKRRRKLS